MIFISTNQDNSDYLEIDRDCMVSLLLSKDVPENIKEIASEMYCKMYEFEKKRDWGHISKISIRKSSYLGNYLLYAHDIEVINKDYIITYIMLLMLLISRYMMVIQYISNYFHYSKQGLMLIIMNY